MPGISIGCGLSAPILPLGVLGLDDQAPAEITALAVPTAPALYEGQDAAGAIPSFATFMASANYVSTAGTIQSVDFLINGAVASSTTVFVDGDILSIRVTDSAANQLDFPLGTVAYKANIQSTVSNEIVIDINPIVPDSERLSLTLSGTDYDGTYTPTAGDIRNGAYNFTDTVSVSGAIGLGDTLSGDDGLWSTPTGTLGLTRQWQADGVDIPGATGLTHVITTAEQGTDVTLAVTGDDGVNPVVTAASAPVSVPGTSSALIGSRIYTSAVVGANDSTADIAGADLSGAAQGDPIYFVVFARDNANNFSAAALTFGGIAATLVSQSDASGVRTLVACYKIDRPANATGDIVVTFSEGVADQVQVVAFAVPDATAEAFAVDVQTGNTDLDVSIDTVAGGVLIGGYMDEESAAPTIAGIGNLALDTSDNDGFHRVTGFNNVAAGETPRTITATSATGSHKAAIAVMIT